MAVNGEQHHQFQCRTCVKRQTRSTGLWLEKGERLGGLETPFTIKREILRFPFEPIILMRSALQQSEICSQKHKGAVRVRRRNSSVLKAEET